MALCPSHCVRLQSYFQLLLVPFLQACFFLPCCLMGSYLSMSFISAYAFFIQYWYRFGFCQMFFACLFRAPTHSRKLSSEFCGIVKLLPNAIKYSSNLMQYHIFYNCFQGSLIRLLLSLLIDCFLVYLFKFWKYTL